MTRPPAYFLTTATAVNKKKWFKMKPNRNYKKLESSYLFYDIEQRVKAYSAEHPDKKLLRLGVGDVTLPLCDAVIKAMYSAVEDQSKKETFHGYMPECCISTCRRS